MAATQPERTGLVERLARRARRIILFERFWPAIVLAAAIVALFVAVSWLSLWTALPRPARALGVVAFAACLAYGLIASLRGLRVSRADALRRLDRDSGLPHRPLSAIEDRLANASEDPLTQALWERSRRQIESVARGVRLAPPSPRLADRDPFALRMAALLALVAAGFVAGSEKDGLVEAAFDWRGVLAGGAGARIDVWIDPPGYTGKPPVVLAAANQKPPGQENVSAPVHSTIVVRASGTTALDIRAEGGLNPVEGKTAPGTTGQAGPSDQVERRLTLDGDGKLTVVHDGTAIGPLAITSVPDQPPTIALVGKPEPTARGSLTLTYNIGDDYGVTGAEAAFSDPVPPDTAKMIRSLVPAPKLALSLPPAPGGLGRGQTTGDLSDNPWAGSEVTLVLSTHDEGGNAGLSAPVRIVLPARPFRNPLARALVEQRQNLVFDPDHHDNVGVALDALMIDPDEFGTSKAIYLGLYTARQRLDTARNDGDLVALADYLWQIALKVEDGDLGQTARDLKAAEQALRDALQRGASPDEIRRLTEDLRRQMDKFLAEMQQRIPRPDQQSRLDPNTKVVTPQQLEQMMRKMQELAEKGDTAEAQRLLDQLQNMMENLRTAQRGSAADQATRELNRDMNDLQKMARDQQSLRDKTFKRGQNARRPGGPQGDADGDDAQQGGSPQDKPDQDQQAQGEDLQDQQQALRQRLEELEKSMRQLGMKGEQGLADAEQAMKEAEGALGKGPTGNRSAVDAQGRALQGLQKGTEGMSQQMAQGQSDESGEGQGEGGQSAQGRSGESGNDPLGRRRDGRGNMEVRGNALDEGVAARAQQVLQELRKRLSNPNRPPDELDYLERLLHSN